MNRGSSSAKPPGFVHVDLDGLWTLAACYGFDERTSFEHDPIFEYALPRLLDLLDRLSIKATFFIVGRDLELDYKRRAVAQIVDHGHELGNHSYSYSIGLEGLPTFPMTYWAQLASPFRWSEIKEESRRALQAVA